MTQHVYEAIAADLRDFGYTTATADQIRDVHQSVQNGEPLPHGIIGMFAEKQIRTAIERGLLKP